MTDLYLLAVNLTRRCNLACAHCYMDAATLRDGGPDELRTEEVRQLLDQIAGRSRDTMVVLTGGEPLLRHDLEELLTHGAKLGLSMVVGSNGVLLNERRVVSLKEAGAMGVGISLDSLDPTYHDQFRGIPGGWEKTLAGMDACRDNGLPFQIHFSVSNGNTHEIASLIDFSRSVGAHVLNIFFLVCTGRGESMSDITPERYEQVLNELILAQEGCRDLIIRARCAPHFKRIAYQRDPHSSLTRAEGYEGGGCLAGIHYCRITPEGAVTACPFIPDEEDNIRRRPFWEIWDRSDTFIQLRNPQLQGKCGECEYRELCGGCRARPKALGGSLMDADPWCSYQPQGQAVIQPLQEDDAGKMNWTPEARQRLERVPGFLRKMVRKRAETYAREQQQQQVTAEHLKVLAARRFSLGTAMPRRPDAPDADQEVQEKEPPLSAMTWTPEASKHLESIPAFLREGVRQVAEAVAGEEGRLEVNLKLVRRLEEEDETESKLPWTTGAEQALEQRLQERAREIRLFVEPTIRAAAEREARRRDAISVSERDVQLVFDTATAGVEWDAEALKRVESAPEFIRAGIKKAAEFNARKEGLERISSNDLTRFRNRAMMRAVRRMKGFGMRELDFDAFDIARRRVPRLKENEQAAQRFSAIRDYVESHQDPEGGGLGLLDRTLIEQMKAELKKR